MSNIRFNWKRFWYPRGTSLNLADDGYLPDSDSESTRFWNKHVVSFEEISGLKALVLLGDPGMGKSTFFQNRRLYGGKYRIVQARSISSSISALTKQIAD
jgi:hypothetical protein